MAEFDKEAFDFIVRQEVTSPAYYTKHYQNPEWPGGASGITVACGYDLGYASPKKITEDWARHVSADMLKVMIHCSGVKGIEAKALLPSVRSQIKIPWDVALDVFSNRDVPLWSGEVQRAVKNTDKVSPLCFGMLVATAYNRGCGGFHSDASRFVEMRHVANDMASTEFKLIGNEFLGMRRLWPNMRGLRDRYTETASLWNKGLSHAVVSTSLPPVAHDGEDPLHAGPARTKPPATTPAQHGTAAVIVGGTAAAVQHAHALNLPLITVVPMAVFGVVVAVTVWWTMYRNRTPP